MDTKIHSANDVLIKSTLSSAPKVLQVIQDPREIRETDQNR
jgi:hypothetical protein